MREEYRQNFGLGEDVMVSVSTQGNGYVTIEGARLPTPEYQGLFFAGNPIVLAAVPSEGEFVQWEDGSTENPRVVTPAKNSIYRAIFN